MWAVNYVFFNRKTKQTIPARCHKWTCLDCAPVNYARVDRLAAAGNPQRFITLSRAGNNPEEVRINLQKLIQALRRQGLVFEYFSTTELHKNGLPHLHLLQRGDFIEQAELSRLWGICTAKSFVDRPSTVVDIRRIREKQNVKGYLLKYLLKGLKADNHTDMSWYQLQAKWKGLNHYRNSRDWAKKPEKKPSEWDLVDKLALEGYEQALTVCGDEAFILDGIGYGRGVSRYPLSGAPTLRGARPMKSSNPPGWALIKLLECEEWHGLRRFTHIAQPVPSKNS
jgi:hypothetical protein